MLTVSNWCSSLLPVEIYGETDEAVAKHSGDDEDDEDREQDEVHCAEQALVIMGGGEVC